MELAGAANDERTVVTAIDLASRAKPITTIRIDSTRSTRSSPASAATSTRNDVLGKDSMARLEQLATKCAAIAQGRQRRRKNPRRMHPHPRPLAAASANNIDTLADFLSAEHDSQLQLAAVDALAERTQPAVADHLLNAWRSLTPALRARVLDVLLSRKQWVGPLLAAIEAQTVLTSEIDAAHQARLSEYPDPELSKKAQEQLRPIVERANGRRHPAINRP